MKKSINAAVGLTLILSFVAALTLVALAPFVSSASSYNCSERGSDRRDCTESVSK